MGRNFAYRYGKVFQSGLGQHASSRQGGIPGGTPMRHQGSRLGTTRNQALFRGRDSATAKGHPRPTKSTTSPWDLSRNPSTRDLNRQGTCRLFPCNTKRLAMHEVFQKTKEYPTQALGITTPLLMHLAPLALLHTFVTLLMRLAP
jgi:hypothetical protein